jgi:hypothetical protein
LNTQSNNIETNTTDLQTATASQTTVVRQTEVAELPHICPTHRNTVLTHLFRGGSGWCSRCQLFVQSVNHAMPVLDAAFIEKREAALAADRKTKRNSAAKARRAKKNSGAVIAAAQ